MYRDVVSVMIFRVECCRVEVLVVGIGVGVLIGVLGGLILEGLVGV